MHPVTVAGFSLVHGHIGPSQQRGDVCAGWVCFGDSHADGDMQRGAIHGHRDGLHRQAQFFCDLLSLAHIRACQQYTELLATALAWWICVT